MAKEDAHELLTKQLVVRGGVVVQDSTSAKNNSSKSPPRLLYIYIYICIFIDIFTCVKITTKVIIYMYTLCEYFHPLL
jgi:hypothetical protein